MRSFGMSWCLIIFLLSFTFNSLSEASHEKKLPAVVVVGAVYCDTCFQGDFSKASHFISGASVSVECRDGRSKPSFQKEAKTNEHGEFKVHLPISVSEHVKNIKACSVKLISSSEPYCAVASTATSSSLHLKSRKQGTHIFSAGFFTFKPQKQPILCNQKPSLQNSKELTSMKNSIPPAYEPASPPPIQDSPTPTSPPINQTCFPPLPLLPMLPPLPQLPPLPPHPELPKLPPFPGKSAPPKPTKSSKTSQLSTQKVAQPDFFFPPPTVPLLPSPSPPATGIPLPPNPLQPPPIVPTPRVPLLPSPSPPATGIPLPPKPLQPPPTVPPNPFQPPPPLINIPPTPGIPGLTPPSPPPVFPFPFPPFPFPFPPKSPGFPGIPHPAFPDIPPASPSSTKTYP